ncbi:MAG: DUF4381 domain-containing protein [Pseudomonadota bacterium]
MENDPLQQLRDIHLPTDPSWWPPAPGWWLLLMALAYVVYRLVRYARYRHQARAPLSRSHVLLDDLYARHASGELSALAFAHETNEVLKRLLVRGYRAGFAARLSGTRWLTLLDQISVSEQFTLGPGQVLGDARFRAAPSIDATELHRVVGALLKRASPSAIAALQREPGE